MRSLKKIISSILVHYGSWIPDKTYLEIQHRLLVGKKLNLKNPQTFTEKLQWLKLYNRRPEYTQMVDKYAAKDYVAKILGQEYIIPTLGVWDRPEDIEWDKLPNQFVLKTTHGGGGAGVVICRDKMTFDKNIALRKLHKAMSTDIYKYWREQQYQNIPKRIIAEKYRQDDTLKDLPDYKFFCFDGEPKYCQVISGREMKMCIDFFDKDWNHQPFHEPKHYPFADIEPQRPKNYEQMWNAARELAKDKPFSRIDFYEVNEKTYFGEITLYPTSGFGGFEPDEHDEILGAMIDCKETYRWGVFEVVLSENSFTIKEKQEELKDYKFYCFNGEVKVGMIASNRYITTHNFNYFDINYNPLPITSSDGPNNKELNLQKPDKWEEMIGLATKLSRPFYHIRVDFYVSDNRVYFGELTFFDSAGFDYLSSDYWNKQWGSWLKLPIEA